MRPSGDTLEQILLAGVRAPTADNRPAWQYRVQDDAVALLLAQGARPAAQPHRRALDLLAAGAAVENMALRSGAFGLLLQPALCPDASRPELVAVLRWTAQAGAGVDPLHTAIEGRHTNRRFYRRAPLAPAAWRALDEAAQVRPEAVLRWLEGDARRCALRAIRRAEGERFRRRGLHEEMFGSIRFDLGWHATADEGLPPGALEVEPPLRGGFALLRHWPVMRAACGVGAHWMLGLRAGWLPCAGAPGLGLISVPRHLGEPGWVHAGRTFERVWLAAQAQGLALQPMAAVVALSLQAAGGDWVSPQVQQRLRRALAVLCAADQQPCMLFRLGQADRPSVVSGRGLLSRYRAPA